MDGYYNDVTNKITSTFNGNMFIWMNLSLGKVEIIGTDVNLQSELELGQWRIRPLLTYTYQRARDFTDPKKVTMVIRFPTHHGTVAVLL